MVDIFGTLGPSCDNEKVLLEMFSKGMTGIRINLSHIMLKDCVESIERINTAGLIANIIPKILIDMQGPELRIGKLEAPMSLAEEDELTFGEKGIPLDDRILSAIKPGQELLLDDGKIKGVAISSFEGSITAKVTRGGLLDSRKSIALPGIKVDMPALTEDDIENIKLAPMLSVYGVMQPFVRSADDLKIVRHILDDNGGENIKLYAKIENTNGIENLESFFEYADEIVIARGDLGNAVPLWELPAVQKSIALRCNDKKIPFMVVTQMLSSMEHSKVPTRAEVSDIYNAVLDGAGSVMVTGETAIGEYPVEVIDYLTKTANFASRNN